MVAAGTNCITQGEDAVIKLLSETQEFRDFCGVSSLAEAAARIHPCEVPLPDDIDSETWRPADWISQFPCAIVAPPEQGEWIEYVQTANDGFHSFNVSLRYSVRLERFATNEASRPEQIRSFMNAAGDVLEAIASRANGYEGEFGFTDLTSVDLYSYANVRIRNMGRVFGLTFELARTVSE